LRIFSNDLISNANKDETGNLKLADATLCGDP
jgi:hypothetical protein